MVVLPRINGDDGAVFPLAYSTIPKVIGLSDKVKPVYGCLDRPTLKHEVSPGA
jgi:hypothetical protein